jgi:hypothetical protein
MRDWRVYVYEPQADRDYITVHGNDRTTTPTVGPTGELTVNGVIFAAGYWKRVIES